MPAPVIERPAATDYAEYYSRYTTQAPAGDLNAIMIEQIAMLQSLLGPLSESAAGFSYAPGKWSIREIVGHLTDTERVFAYRATAFSRGDTQPLPGFDEALWNPQGEYNRRSLADLLAEWGDTRRATMSLLRAMPRDALGRFGIASGKEISVLACLTILPGHVNHHVAILRDRYLGKS